MIISALDSNHDFTFGQGLQNYLITQLAINENIQTRLLEFLNDAFWNLSAGLDWLRLLGTPGTANEILLTCRAKILQSYGVVGVNSITASISGRQMIINANINTIYSPNVNLSVGVPPNA